MLFFSLRCVRYKVQYVVHQVNNNRIGEEDEDDISVYNLDMKCFCTIVHMTMTLVLIFNIILLVSHLN